jgi:diguanylate cyclase (GGDEF)-like protein
MHVLSMVPGQLGQRRILAYASLAIYVAIVFFALARIEVPGLGFGHLLYLPVALLALATGPLWGVSAGAAATAVYLLGALINPQFHARQELLSIAGTLRFVSFVGIGWLVGASAARNRQLMQRLREHAERDFLTDLLNTRAFEAALGERLAEGQPFALVLADVDELKHVNDTEGHAAGNDYLRRLAAVLREETAPEDTVARIGGDEFSLLIAIESAADADAASLRLQAALARRGISASFGYAVSPAEGAGRLALFHIADKRLYEGKLSTASGRLRSVS